MLLPHPSLCPIHPQAFNIPFLDVMGSVLGLFGLMFVLCDWVVGLMCTFCLCTCGRTKNKSVLAEPFQWYTWPVAGTPGSHKTKPLHNQYRHQPFLSCLVYPSTRQFFFISSTCAQLPALLHCSCTLFSNSL